MAKYDVSGRAQAAFAAALLAALVAVPSLAETIPENMLAADYDNCVLNAQKNQHLTTAQVDAYCTCARDEIRQRFDFATYSKMSLELAAGNASAETTRLMSGLVQDCANRTLR